MDRTPREFPRIESNRNEIEKLFNLMSLSRSLLVLFVIGFGFNGNALA
jgi:hypothetical protein